MDPTEPLALSQWLSTMQDYRASPAAAERIGAVVNRYKKVEQTFEAHTLFWTEPANLDTTLLDLSPANTPDD